jgi:hypothetical protein
VVPSVGPNLRLWRSLQMSLDQVEDAVTGSVLPPGRRRVSSTALSSHLTHATVPAQ